MIIALLPNDVSIFFFRYRCSSTYYIKWGMKALQYILLQYYCSFHVCFQADQYFSLASRSTTMYKDMMHKTIAQCSTLFGGPLTKLALLAATNFYFKYIVSCILCLLGNKELNEDTMNQWSTEIEKYRNYRNRNFGMVY